MYVETEKSIYDKKRKRRHTAHLFKFIEKKQKLLISMNNKKFKPLKYSFIVDISFPLFV